MLAMSLITVMFVALGAFVPYAASGIQDQMCLSQTSVFDTPEFNIKLNSSNSLLSHLRTFATYDSALEVNGATKMSDGEVVSNAREYIKKLNKVGFIGDFGKEEDLVTSLYPELCYSSSIGESAFIWSCVLGTRDKSYLADLVIDDTSGKVLSISVEQNQGTLSGKRQNRPSEMYTDSNLAGKASEALAEYLNVELQQIENVDDFISNYLKQIATSNEDDKKGQIVEDAKSLKYDIDRQYDENTDQEVDAVDYGDFPGLGSREASSSIIEEEFFRIKGSDIYFRIAYSFFSNSETDGDTSLYWNIVPFYTVL